MADKVKLTTLWQRRSSRTGKTYFSGYLGSARVIVLKDERADVPDGADAIWNVFVEEAPPRQSASKPPRTIEATAAVPPSATSGGQRFSTRPRRQDMTAPA